jgi:hypothetical protein
MSFVLKQIGGIPVEKAFVRPLPKKGIRPDVQTFAKVKKMLPAMNPQMGQC